MNLFIKSLGSLLIIIYPLVIYYGLNYFEPKYLVIFLGVILLVRFITSKSQPLFSEGKQQIAIIITGVAIIIFTLFSNSLSGLKVYPVLVSISLLFIFSMSLYFPPTTIERIARLTDPDLSEQGILYTRTVTKIWCLFFIINGIIAFYTSFFTSVEIWTLYNGLISYLLMGSLFGCEYMYRKFILKI